ncbi:MAG: hypothetical protein V4750_02040 [Pseudomonadota bacterium]
MKKFLTLTLAALVAALLPALASAQTSPTRKFVFDSTGVKGGVTSTLVPSGVSSADVYNIVTNVVADTKVMTSSIPPGYREVVRTMGPRALPAGAADAAEYVALNYPIYAVTGVAPGTDVCGGNHSPRIVVVAGSPAYDSSDGTSVPATPDQYFVCEPQGTRTTLVKTTGAQTAAVGRAQIDAFKISPAVGVSVQATTQICQGLGYTSYVAGSITSTQPFSCGDQITRWSGTTLYNDTACYNNVLQGMTCWK